MDKLKEYELVHCAKVNPNNLSSGQKKKLMLVFAELAKPELLIIDEPEANLDPTSRILLYKKLQELAKMGISVFVSTHLINEIREYVDFATFIKDGKTIWNDKLKSKNHLEELYRKLIIKEGSYETD